jgi:hypothetical protein
MAEGRGNSISMPAHRGALRDCTDALAGKLLSITRNAV